MFQRKYDTVLITTVFPLISNFLDEFFSSLKEQTNRNFDILIANDGIERKYLNKYLANFENVIIIDVESSPAKNREIIINQALNLEYKYLIFGDADDYFAKNRVAIVKSLLNSNFDIIVNDIKNNGKITKPFFQNIEEGEIGDLKSIISEYNMLGLSNSAVKSEIVNFTLNFPGDVIAVDWLFFSQIIVMSNPRVYFTNRTKTYYRQYNHNSAGIVDKNLIDYNKIKKAIEIKKTHYTKMIEFTAENNQNEYRSFFKRKLASLELLEEKISSQSFRNFYLNYLVENWEKFHKGWWSEAMLLNEKIF